MLGYEAMAVDVAAAFRRRDECAARLALMVGLDEAARAVELAELIGLEAGRASTAPTTEVVDRYLGTIEWLAALGRPLPQNEEAMRAAFKEKSTRDLFASLGVAFPWS